VCEFIVIIILVGSSTLLNKFNLLILWDAIQVHTVSQYQSSNNVTPKVFTLHQRCSSLRKYIEIYHHAIAIVHTPPALEWIKPFLILLFNGIINKRVVCELKK
jgi:hypothetical protein